MMFNSKLKLYYSFLAVKKGELPECCADSFRLGGSERLIRLGHYVTAVIQYGESALHAAEVTGAVRAQIVYASADLDDYGVQLADALCFAVQGRPVELDIELRPEIRSTRDPTM